MICHALGRVRLYAALALLIAALLALRAKAADFTPAEFENQGEYTGEVFVAAGEMEVGVQVYAQGDKRFTAVGYEGGLPGDGWDAAKRKGDNGILRDGVIKFMGSCELKNGVFSVMLGGVPIAELKKVERESPTLGVQAPPGAIVLFDGSNTDAWQGAKIDMKNGLLMPGGTSVSTFGSGKLHVEFYVPFMPKARGEARGNSGVVLMDRYEIQILDSFGLEESDTGCGAIYGVRAPDVNMSLPPMAWQTFDIDFTAPETIGYEKLPALVTVKHNGQSIHRKAKLLEPTKGATLEGRAATGPLRLEDHAGDPVRFGRIWFLPKGAEKPAETDKPQQTST